MADRIIKIEPHSDGWHDNERGTGVLLKDGYAVVRPADEQLLKDCGGYVTFDTEDIPATDFPDVVDRRSAPSDAFPVAANMVAAKREEQVPADTTTPAERRQTAYETEKAIQWPEDSGTMLTVTEAARQWEYYAAEGDTGKTGQLTALIAAAKEAIRAKYPDAEGSGQ